MSTKWTHPPPPPRGSRDLFTRRTGAYLVVVHYLLQRFVLQFLHRAPAALRRKCSRGVSGVIAHCVSSLNLCDRARARARRETCTLLCFLHACLFAYGAPAPNPHHPAPRTTHSGQTWAAKMAHVVCAIPPFRIHAPCAIRLSTMSTDEKKGCARLLTNQDRSTRIRDGGLAYVHP